jgi:hypothetical protein
MNMAASVRMVMVVVPKSSILRVLEIAKAHFLVYDRKVRNHYSLPYSNREPRMICKTVLVR